MGNKIRLFIVILSFSVASAVGYANSIENDTLFVREIESLMPQMVQWRLDELHQIRQEVTSLKYAGICEYYTRKYHDWKYDESAVELSVDSIIMTGIDYLLKKRCFSDESVPYFLMRCATRLSETGYPEEARFFAAAGVEIALAQGNGGYIYEELRCLESDLDVDASREASLQTRLRMLRGFKSEYENSPGEDSHDRYLRHLLKTSELALNLDNADVADSLLQESLDLVYDRKNPDVASGKVSVIVPTSPYRFQMSAIASEIALKKGDCKMALDIQESLLWRYYESWVLRQLSAHDYISYFNAITSLIEAGRFNKQNCEHLVYASKIIKDWICNLSYKTSPRLRTSHYSSARSLIKRINSVLVNYMKVEEVNEAIYNNVLLFKNLQLQVDKALLLNAHDDPRLDFNEYKDDFNSNIVVAILRTTLDYLRKQWALEREALEKPEFLAWIQCDRATVSHSLPPNGIAIEFFTTQRNGLKSYFAAIADSKSDTPQIINLFDASSIPNFSSGRLYRDKSFSEKLWGKLHKYLTPGCSIYYSPEGQLYNIALEHLQSLNDKSLCIADVYRVSRVSTTRELSIDRNNNNAPKTKMAFFSDIDYDNPTDEISVDIPENRGSLIHCLKTKGRFSILKNFAGSKHIEHIAKTYGIEIDSYNNADATKEAFYGLSEKYYNLIHISTHGFYIPVDSIYRNSDYKNLSFVNFSPGISAEDLSMNSCGLALSGANRIFEENSTDRLNAGILTASEISAINLSNIDFIFLSACQTGLGYISSDGVYGLQRGFKIAGVKSMIYTLWDVNNDACEMFEKEFYTNYFAGRSKYESFVAARNKLRSFIGVYNGRPYDFSNPKYWAGFVLHDGL